MIWLVDHLRQIALDMRYSLLTVVTSAVMGDEESARYFDETGALVVCDRRIHSKVSRDRVRRAFDWSMFTEEWHLVVSNGAVQFDGDERRFLKDAMLVRMLHGTSSAPRKK